jgi:hypothetical protein
MSKKKKDVTITIHLRPDQDKLVQEMAARSELTVERWLYLAIDSAAAIDAAHWAEMAEREHIKREIALDRERFGRLSVSLRNLSDGCFNVLVDHLVSEREKGRAEGSESAKRLAAVRAAARGA